MHPNLYWSSLAMALALGLWAADKKLVEMGDCLREWASVFTVVAVICNRRSPLHRDPLSHSKWFDVMTSVGDYGAARMKMPNIGIEVVYDSGVMVVGSGRIVRHGVDVMDGDRIGWVWYMRDDVYDVEPTIPGTLVESPLTEPETYKTPVRSPTEKSFSCEDDSVLRPVRSYSDMVRTRTDTPQPGAEKGSADAISTVVGSDEGTDTITSAPINAMKPAFMTSSDESDENDTPWKRVKRHHKKPQKVTGLSETKTPIRVTIPSMKLKGGLPKKRSSASSTGRLLRDELSPMSVECQWTKERPKAKVSILATEEISMLASLKWTLTPNQVRSEASNTDNVQGSEEEISNLLEQAVRAAEARVTKSFEDQMKRLHAEIIEKEALLAKKGKTNKAKTNHSPKDLVMKLVEKAMYKGSKKHFTRASPAAMDAMVQIAPKSYLGRAFNKIKRGKCTKPHKDPIKDPSDRSSSTMTMTESNPDSPSTSSSSSLSSSSSEESMSSSEDEHPA
ncbi:hypothetical protein DFJ58DRAFT_722775 [Suillus subalutaceus]|uniref:uncharacterized protein n=1 Tax=Suillus subalutaceus TaxID=48586 RepID=UPI001B870060|nr:uncharacterized protein DFJ58DRAFT_722775 [Suillus subalutaceus]KAG1871351.1 hypothetical protein DFJ58DRAFT_722775 [Suillus subalutaceus]